MNREKQYHKLGKRFMRLDEAEKKAKSDKEEIRRELSGLMRDEFAEKDYLLPTISESIPNAFFHLTGISKEDFLKTRYPGWTLLKEIVEEEDIVFILQKQPQYIGKVIELDDAQISKIVVEYTPEIDWETLNKEFPELADKISQIQETIVVNEAALEEEAKNNPELFSILRRHTKTKMPSEKFLPRRVQNDGDE